MRWLGLVILVFFLNAQIIRAQETVTSTSTRGTRVELPSGYEFTSIEIVDRNRVLLTAVTESEQHKWILFNLSNRSFSEHQNLCWDAFSAQTVGAGYASSSGMFYTTCFSENGLDIIGYYLSVFEQDKQIRTHALSLLDFTETLYAFSSRYYGPITAAADIDGELFWLNDVGEQFLFSNEQQQHLPSEVVLPRSEQIAAFYSRGELIILDKGSFLQQGAVDADTDGRRVLNLVASETGYAVYVTTLNSQQG